ncbi:MAG: Cyclic nucleotide-binding domain protein [Alphaproteobacteria bacterium ADurb.Bin438]|nr:MAG: Cyclic nucleotide-binding domain protein [Alphaproteobacteria bacterium ADurb.Bin438]
MTMIENTISFKSGDIIFKEGEPADYVFRILLGSVEIKKRGSVIEKLSSSDFIGIEGVATKKGVYEYTAIASLDVELVPIYHEDFIELMKTDNEVALYVSKRAIKVSSTIGVENKINNNPKSLIEAVSGQRITSFRTDIVKVDEKVNQGNLEQPKPASKNLFKSILKERSEVELRSLKEDFFAILANVEGDYTKGCKNWALSCFHNIPKVRVSEIESVFKISSLSEMDLFNIFDLISKFNANVVVIGEVDESERILEFKFLSSENPYFEGGIGFYLHNSLFIPINGGNEFYKLLRVCLLGAMSSNDALKKERLNLLLEDALVKAHSLIENPNSSLSSKEHAYNLICYANACYKKGMLDKRGYKYLNEAMTIYSLSLPLLPEVDARMTAFVNHQLGCLNNYLASKSGKISEYRKALSFFEEALKSSPKEIEPMLWANLNFKIGELCFKLAIIENKEEDFFKSINCFNASSTIYTKEDDALKWSEIMTFMARVLLIHGEEYRNYDEVKKAMDFALNALSVRDKSVVPVLWANSKSVLASGLFLYGRNKKDKTMIYDAKKAFFDAKEVYLKAGVHSQVVTSDKNINKIEEHLIEMQKDEEFLEKKKVKTIFDGLDMSLDRDEGYNKGDKRDIGKY